MTVTEQSLHRHDHEGRTYFFCSEKCRAKFAADPDDYRTPRGFHERSPSSSGAWTATGPMSFMNLPLLLRRLSETGG